MAANTAPCGGCWACIRNRESLCENLEFLNGAFAEQVVIPRAIVDRNTYVIPDDLDFEAAAPLEPLATVVHGMAESGIDLGDTVVVHGAGPIGLMFVRLATLRGANVISVDQSPWRLQQAQMAGAVETIDLSDITGPRGAGRGYQGRNPRRPRGRRRDRGGRAGGGVGADGSQPASWRHGRAVRWHPQGCDVLRRLVRDALRGVHAEGRVPPHSELRADRSGAAGVQEGRRPMLVTEVRPLEDLVPSLEDMAAGRGSKYVLTP